MKVQIYGKNITVTEAIAEKIQKKLNHLEKYFIIDENNSLKEELEGQESDSSDKIEFRYIYSLEEIEK